MSYWFKSKCNVLKVMLSVTVSPITPKRSLSSVQEDIGEISKMAQNIGDIGNIGGMRGMQMPKYFHLLSFDGLILPNT